MLRSFLAFLTLAALAMPAAAQDAVLRSAGNGPWSAPATWEGGKVPGAGARVLIRAGHDVLYDVKSEAVIRAVNVSGILRFATERDTRLDVGLLLVQPGDKYSEEGFDCDFHVRTPDADQPKPVLEVGSAHQPIEAGHTALIRLHYLPGMDRESCPAIVCCGGRMDFYGAPLSRTWLRLDAPAKKGEITATLEAPVTGWNVGDRVILTATQRDYGKTDSYTEERLITAIAGTKVTLDRPLDYDHRGGGEYRGEIANLTRNIVVESATPAGVRGHTMYHRGSTGSVHYAEFRHLGKKDVLGRYSMHYHLCGDSLRGSSVVGASIWDSHNRWLTVHGTNYLVVRDCVGYKSIGHGYFLEDGTEVFNVFDRNLAVGARRGKPLPQQVLAFDHNDGAGFWWANSHNTFTRNVAVDNAQYGFRYEATPTSRSKLDLRVQQPDGSYRVVDIRTLPFVRFDDNETHSNTGLYGVNLGEGTNRVGPDARHPFVVRNLKIWDMHYALRPQVPSLLLEKLHISNATYGVYHPNYDRHVYRDVYIRATNDEPFNRGHDDDSIQYGDLAVDGLTFDECYTVSIPLIQISDSNPSGKASSHFRNVKVTNWKGGKERSIVNLGGGERPTPKTAKGVPIFLHDWYGPGRTALVVSMKSSDYRNASDHFKADPPLTGDASRVMEIAAVPFPTLLDPVDDVPPTTVITDVQPGCKGKRLVRGTTADNGTVRRVVVNGVEARSLAPNFAEWEATLETSAARLQAHAEDTAGNVEPRPHIVVVK